MENDRPKSPSRPRTSKCNIKRPVRRVVDEEVRGRPIVAEMHPGFVRVREYGRRSFYEVPWSAVYMLGARMQAAQAKREVDEQRAVSIAARR
jgi:hypothetical protein